MRIILTIVFLLVVCLNNLNAQKDTLKKGHLYYATIIDGDTIPVVFMNTAYVWKKRTFKTKREQKRYNRLQRAVKVVYPYAKLANQLMAKYEKDIESDPDPRKRKKFYKKVERELLDEYGDDMYEMTKTQGRILIKLIDRETNKTSYELVKEFRSGVTAFFWQGIARVFGHNLKSEYNATEEDKYLEEIVLSIEQGRY